MTTAEWVTIEVNDTDDTVREMVNVFCKNVSFDEQTQKDCGVASKPCPEELTVQRYTVSYMNHVIRIRVKRNPRLGYILKLAPPCMQYPGVTQPAPVERGEREFQVLRYFRQTAPLCVPQAVFYDYHSRILCTQEMSGFQSLSEAMLLGEFSEAGSRAFGANLASVHAATHVLRTGKDKLQELVQTFPTLEPMIDIIRVFHYDRPFDPDDSGKRCAPEVKALLSDLYGDPVVMATVAKVKKRFLEVKDCLIHGDLHIDSIIVSSHDFKMVDGEFARVGPSAFDVGLLLATMLLVYYRHKHRQPLMHLNRTYTNKEEQKEVEKEEKGEEVEKEQKVEVVEKDEAEKDEDEVEEEKESKVEEGEKEEKEKMKEEYNKHKAEVADDKTKQELEPEKAAENQEKEEGQFCRSPNNHLRYETNGDARKMRASTSKAHVQSLAMCSAMLQSYVDHLSNSLQQDASFKEHLVRDIATFTAGEILSCIIGPSHFDFMDESSQAQMDGVTSALRLLRHMDDVRTTDDIITFLSYGDSYTG